MDNEKLSAVFNRFVGQPLRNPERLTCDVDPVLADMHTAAEENGLKLRLLFPGQIADRALRSDRVTVHAERDVNGSYRVARFKLG